MGEVERVNSVFSASLANNHHQRVGQTPQRQPRKRRESYSQDDTLELHSENEEENSTSEVAIQFDSDELDLSA